MLTNFFKISNIGTYRTELMGISTWMILLLHFPLFNDTLLENIQGNLFLGVEIFIMLSGFGLYYSFQKNNDIKKFYFKRLYRIMPFYFFICVVYTVLKGDSMMDFILYFSTIGFYGGVNYDWFVPFILLFYLFYPILLNFIKKRIRILIAMCFVTAFLSFLLLLCFEINADQTLYISRIPISFIGIGLAIANTYDAIRQVKYAKIICVCSLVTVLVMYWANSQWPIENIMSYTLLKSLLSVVLLFGITNMLIPILPKFLLKSLSWIGQFSLEIYLIQKLFIYHNREPLFPFYDGRISNFLCILFSVVIAVILCLILRCCIGSFIKTQA